MKVEKIKRGDEEVTCTTWSEMMKHLDEGRKIGICNYPRLDSAKDGVVFMYIFDMVNAKRVDPEHTWLITQNMDDILWWPLSEELKKRTINEDVFLMALERFLEDHGDDILVEVYGYGLEVRKIFPRWENVTEDWFTDWQNILYEFLPKLPVE